MTTTSIPDPCRSRHWFTAAAGLVLLLGVPCVAQEFVPPPAQAFTPRTALAIYADLQGASQSSIWKALETKAPALLEGLKSLPGVQVQMQSQFQSLPAFQPSDIAELAIAIEGENALRNMETEQFDPDFGLVAAVRLAKSVDVNQVLQRALDEADKDKPGARARLEQSRTRVGAAEVFDLPREMLGDRPPPFPMSAALGSGKEGSIFMVGKSETLKNYLTGKTDGRLPAGIAAGLARRGQVWLYLPVRADMTKGLQGGAAGNPMMANLAPGLEKVKEFGLGLNFGSGKVDFEVAVGCADAAGAQELTRGLQQFLGVLQMSAAQNPAAAPPFLSKLKAAADGTAFRLTTELTERDLDLALKTTGGGRAVASTPSKATPPPEAEPLPVAGPPPVDVELLELLPSDEQALRFTRLRVVNRSPKPVREIRLTFQYYDRGGRKIGQWTRRHQDPVADQLIAGEATREVRCPTFHVPSTTTKVSLVLHEVVFGDGQKWLKPS
jgi:hypothetical protein